MQYRYAESASSIIRTIVGSQKAYWFYMCFYNCICFLGIVGNVLSAIVLRRKALKSSASYLLLGLTFFDSMLLITNFLAIGIGSILFYRFPINSDWIEYHLFIFFHFLYPLSKTAYTGSVYMTLAITLERYIAICYPFRARRLFTTRRAIHSILCVLTFSILFNLTRWIEQLGIGMKQVQVESETLTQKVYLSENYYYRKYYLVWMWTAVMYVIPLLIVGIMNLRIYLELKWTLGKRNSITRSSMGQDESSITRLLLSIVAIFVICNLTNCFLFFLPRIIGFTMDLPAEMEVLTSIPLILNSSINFVIYCVMGKNFREQYAQIMPSCFVCWRDNNNLRNSTSTTAIGNMKTSMAEHIHASQMEITKF